MATRAERILTGTKRAVNLSEEKRGELEIELYREKTERARITEQMENRKEAVWDGTGIPELIQEICQELEGARVEFRCDIETQKKYKTNLWGDYTEEVIRKEYEYYAICLYTGGKHQVTVEYVGSELEDDVIIIGFRVRLNQSISPSLIHKQVGSRKRIEEMLEKHLREVSSRRGIKFKKSAR